MSQLGPLGANQNTRISLPPLSQLMGNWVSQGVSAQATPPRALSLPLPLQKPDQLFETNLTAAAKSPAQAELGFVHQPLLGPDDRVLHIGDSHTVGIYGHEMDKLLRSSGAQVETYGSAGSSPSWWFSGQTTHSGFYSKDAEGHVDQPANWRSPHATPKFPDLVQKFQPNVIVISLGANLIHASGKTIETQVEKMAQAAKASGARLIWIGPPDGRESKKPTSRQNELYAHLQKIASQYGDFIDSRPLTEYPAHGGDGLHYWGKEGGAIARSWAHAVYEQIQDLN